MIPSYLYLILYCYSINDLMKDVAEEDANKGIHQQISEVPHTPITSVDKLLEKHC